MIGRGIKYIRKLKGLNQSDLAKIIGSTQEHISKIETDFHTPSKEMIEKISEALKAEPIIFYWYSVTEDDIPKDKVEDFKVLKPSIDELFNLIFKINI